jgi:hypothetical protein
MTSARLIVPQRFGEQRRFGLRGARQQNDIAPSFIAGCSLPASALAA